MRSWGYSALYILLGLMLLFSCGKDRGNPVAPSRETFTIRGITFNAFWSPSEKTVIRIAGNGIDKTVNPEANGEFSITELPTGKYVVRAGKNGFILYPDILEVTLPGAEKNILNFIIFYPAEYDNLMQSKDCRIYGRVVTEDGTPVLNVQVSDTETNQWGFSNDISPGDTLLLVPKKEGYSYAFIPDSLVVVADRKILFANFIARNEGAPLHSISGRIILKDYSYIPLISLVDHSQNHCYTQIDSTGSFKFPDIKDGSYSIQFNVWNHRFEKNKIPVVLNGADIVLKDIIGTYIGPTYYPIYGRVVTPEGIGIAKVHVEYHSDNPYGAKYLLETDAHGDFIADRADAPIDYSVRYTIRPFLDSCTFTPDSAYVTVIGIEGVYRGDAIVLPDFVGRDYSHILAEDYFPLNTGASWTYERTQTSEPVQEYSFSFPGMIANDGVNYFHTVNPGLGGLNDFRIESNSVRTYSRNRETEILRFGVVPGTQWDIGLASETYPTIGKFLGLENVTVPSGTYTDCAKYEVRTGYGVSGTSYELHTLWLAKGIGMARSEYTLVNYGATKESVTLSLRKFTP